MAAAGGAELGCIAAAKVLEICLRPETKTIVGHIARHMRDGLQSIMASHADFFIGIRQRGVVMGLEFDHPEGAMHVMEMLYQNGVWAIFSTLDPRVLQFKPGILLDREYQFLLSRVAPAGTDLVGDWVVRRRDVEID
ncbi:MAG: hypothetical protein IIB53_09240 [Planctomycetes bacterium]|nr:hypothetical protein [Planctomycetota bacterium]